MKKIMLVIIVLFGTVSLSGCICPPGGHGGGGHGGGHYQGPGHR